MDNLLQFPGSGSAIEVTHHHQLGILTNQLANIGQLRRTACEKLRGDSTIARNYP